MFRFDETGEFLMSKYEFPEWKITTNISPDVGYSKNVDLSFQNKKYFFLFSADYTTNSLGKI